MATIPTVEELGRKAEQARQDADEFQTPVLRAKMFESAAEYERLAKRAEEFEEGARIGASNEAILEGLASQVAQRSARSAHVTLR